MMLNNIYQLLKNRAEQKPDAIALLAPNRGPLTNHSLYLHTEYIVKRLNGLGIVRNDRVAIVLPNGPEMATAFLGVASGATSAPLNPDYHKADFEFYLSDLHAKALLIQSNLDSPARAVAKAQGIPIIEISRNPQDAAGLFYFEGREPESIAVANFAMPEDVALVLHTSGTTSRPKIVPLTHKNICISAFNIKETLQLTEKDCCLNVMPLFHIHGLMAVILASLYAGGSIVCTPGFHADQFFEWLRNYQPTWYSAVPTMHQAILSKVDENQDSVTNRSLRFIRSSSASLPPLVMKRLEEVFHAPVIEAYGMTEASHQMASNPLPPRQRKPGTVGVAAGPEVKIMNDEGKFLPAGQTGEIVIRGDNVTSGYENNPSANQTAFTNGWFRTGDLGVIDTDGYLSITGRLKEMINRGGEKIAPREVDEALLDHPDIVQAVAFAVPHPTLGEDLAAAVVLRDKSGTTERELREFVFSNLADFKVPSQIVIVDEIPKGPTGKIQRIGLAEKLDSSLKADYISPTDSFEKALARIWADELGLPRVGIHDNFFILGGDSLSAASVILSIEELVHRKLEPAILFRAPTVEQLASLLQDNLSDAHSCLVPLQPSGSKKPLFLVPGHGGDVFTFVDLARHLQPEQPVYAFRFPEPAMQDDDVANAMLKDMAASYITEMRNLQPDGPYMIAGFCYGGELAFEIAQQLLSQGQKASLVVIIYAYLEGSIRKMGYRRISHHLNEFLKSNPREKIAYLAKRISNIIERSSRIFFPNVTRTLVQDSQNTVYFPMYYPGKIILFRPSDGIDGMYYDPQMGWGGLAAEIESYDVPGDKYTIFKAPNVQIFAEYLKKCLENSTQ